MNAQQKHKKGGSEGWRIPDPGNAGAIPVDYSGVCPLTSAAAETRTLAAPTYLGQRITFIQDVFVGNVVMTVAHAFNTTGNTIITFGAAGHVAELVAVQVAGALVWREVRLDGAAGS